MMKTNTLVILSLRDGIPDIQDDHPFDLFLD